MTAPNTGGDLGGDKDRHAEIRASALARVSETLSANGEDPAKGTDAVLAAIAAEVVRLLADGCCVSLVTDDGLHLRPASIRHRDPETEAVMARLMADHDYGLYAGPMGRVLREGEAVLVPRVDSSWLDDLTDEVYLAVLEHVDLGSLMYVPLLPRGEAAGVLVAWRGHDTRPFTRADLALLEEVGLWAALALGNARSIVERRRAEERFRRLTDTLPVIVFQMRFAPEFAVEYMSPAVYTILGFTPAEVQADPDLIWLAIHPEDRPVFERLARRPEELASPFVVRYIHQDGHIVWCETRCRLEWEGKQIVAIDGVTSDVTAVRDVEAALTRRALHDPLTGLPNLMLFREHLHHAFTRRRAGVASPALLIVDLDDFVAVNASRGQGVADRVLAELATRVPRVVDAGVTVARSGGDEFAFLFEDVAEPVAPVRVAEELRIALSQPVETDGGPVTVRASMGIAFARPDGTDSPDDLLKHADAAVQSARRKGGDRYEVFDRPMRDRVAARLRTEAALGDALQRGEFTLVYQPEVRIDTGEVVAVEALLRWRHPERGLLEPHEFLQAAEDSGLLVPIGAWVLETACLQQARWTRLRADRAAPAVVVNLSPRQIADPDVVADVAAVMARTGVEPAGLRLDVTEAALTDEPVTALAVLQAFRRLGIRVAVDDFGTGYASLSIVRTFPVDAVKIDRSVVAVLTSDPAASGVCSAIIEMAAGCGLEVSAEGVETPGQRDRLVTLGATLAQGDLFRPAVPPEELGLTLALVPD